MKKIFMAIALCLVCAVSFLSCSKPISTDPKDYEQIGIIAGNGDTVLVNIPYSLKYEFCGTCDIENVQNVMQAYFDDLKNQCNHPYTFIPNEIFIFSEDTTIEYHFIYKDEKYNYDIDTIINITFVSSHVTGVASNGFGVQGEVEDIIYEAFYKGKDNLLHDIYVSENCYRYYGGKKHRTFTEKTIKNLSPYSFLLKINDDELIVDPEIMRFYL